MTNTTACTLEELQSTCAGHVHLEWDADNSAIWFWMARSERPNFNPDLLAALARLQSDFKGAGCCLQFEDGQRPVEFVIFASENPGVFNLGGDLSLFRACVESGDREALRRYARACIDVLVEHHRGYDGRVATCSLVQGLALGGGFEAALSSSWVIAEEQASFGFPEIRFNLFPGMGAYNLTTRHVASKAAERLIMDGEVRSARAVADIGLIHEVVPDGHGIYAVQAWLRHAGHGRQKLLDRLSNLQFHITDSAIEASIDAWIDCVMMATGRDTKMMWRLVRSQEIMMQRIGRNADASQKHA